MDIGGALGSVGFRPSANNWARGHKAKLTSKISAKSNKDQQRQHYCGRIGAHASGSARLTTGHRKDRCAWPGTATCTGSFRSDRSCLDESQAKNPIGVNVR